MPIHPRAGTLPLAEDCINLDALLAKYYEDIPMSASAIPDECKISFGTSGHRGKASNYSFNEAHILAITQAVCDIRREDNIHGLLFLGIDTHALSLPAFKTAIEVLVANEVNIAVQGGVLGKQFTPTPVISHAIINANRGKKNDDSSRADGIIITPSHNPPTDGGFKYNPPHGGPADTSITKRIEARANSLLLNKNKEVKRIEYAKAKKSSCLIEHDYIAEYTNDLAIVLDMQSISQAEIKIGVDPLSGSSLQYWEPIAEKYKLKLKLISKKIDPTFKNIPLDHDGKIRMDCSSPYVMTSLLASKDKFDIAFACDPDADRHGIVTPHGLVPANHYLAVASNYLVQNRQFWSSTSKIGKTIVTSTMLDRVAASHNREIYEVPVGFKYFVDPLTKGACCFACEESAGATFLAIDGRSWTTDKDGLLLCLLSAEMLARTGKNPHALYKDLEQKHGIAHYTRIDSPASKETREAFKTFTPENISATSLASEPISAITTQARGNNENFGGFKISSQNSWFAARPSGTEDICKVYIESFASPTHFEDLKKDAVNIVNSLLD